MGRTILNARLYARHRSPLGEVYCLSSVAGLTHLCLTEEGFLRIIAKYPAAGEVLQEDSKFFTILFDLLGRYFKGEPVSFERPEVPLSPEGTPFQVKVWEALRRIPYGELLSYGDIANAVGSPGAARAVGSACSANPLPIIIPCHRVIAGSGAIGGYSALAGGVGVKRRLLNIEGVMDI